MAPRSPERNAADLSWFTRGNCRLPENRHVDMHPSDGPGVATAKKVCEHCPVEQQCLEYALEFNEDNGVWGRKSERERRRLRKRRRIERAQAS